MYKDSEYIRFDWAIKRILRDKANFGVLEGLMTIQDRRAYERFMINLHADRDVWETAKRDGWNEGLKAGRAKGMKEGRAEGLLFAAKNMKQKGVPIDTITEVTGLTKEQVESL